jgi:LytS/YehU family sensor histidine kinase
MSKKALYWICQIGGWLFFVLAQSIFFKLNNQLSSSLIISLSILFTLGVFISHLYRNTIIRLGWLKLNALQLIPRVIFSTIVLAALLEYTQYGIGHLIDIPIIKHNSTATVVINILNLTPLFFLWSLIYFLVHYIENYKKVEIENLKLQASINEIELNKLKSQLNPHFMFNAMNSIRALIDENPEKSKDAVTQLSNILRSTLLMGKNKIVPFHDELKIVEDYLALETVRYEERLKTKINIHPDSKQFTVPPLMIQTLIENGIKHGISKLTKGGTIELHTHVENNKLIIQIINSGQLSETKGSTGFGIKNTEQRLELLYGRQAELKIRNRDSENVIAEISIPKDIIS